MTLQLHDLRRVAHKVGLTVLERGDGKLLVTCGGTPKHLREKVVDTLEEAWELVMAERNGREPLLRGKY